MQSKWMTGTIVMVEQLENHDRNCLTHEVKCPGPWMPAGIGNGGALAPPPLETLKCVFFLLQMLSKTSVGEYLCIILRKCRQLMGASSPDPHRGTAPGPCWGTSVLQTHVLSTLEESCGRPCSGLPDYRWLGWMLPWCRMKLPLPVHGPQL